MVSAMTRAAEEDSSVATSVRFLIQECVPASKEWGQTASMEELLRCLDVALASSYVLTADCCSERVHVGSPPDQKPIMTEIKALRGSAIRKPVNVYILNGNECSGRCVAVVAAADRRGQRSGSVLQSPRISELRCSGPRSHN